MNYFTPRIRIVTAFLLVAVLLSSCASTTFIDSYPSGADLYLNGEAVGQTPYEMRDTKPMFSCTSVRIEKDDYRTFYTTICRDEEVDVGAIVGGFICTIPFIWSFKYKPTHFYRLTPAKDENKTDESFKELIDNENNSDEE